MSAPKYVDTGALFSSCGAYRYALFRRWEEGRRTLVVVGLNPSTADATNDDPTIRRCVCFAKRDGCSALVMLNLFALRATDPRVMLAHPDPVGPENDATIRVRAWADETVAVAAWGVHGDHLNRPAAVRRIVPHLNCWGVTKDGHPRHPLYLRADTPLVSYSAALAAQVTP